jgi:nitrate reductase gamma subunit
VDTWIDLARGPLFKLSLAICLLGLAYRFGDGVWQIGNSYRRAGDKRLPRAAIVRSTLRWIFPIRSLSLRPAYGLASLFFHLGILLVPLFYVGHVTQWAGRLPFAWPILGPAIADPLSLLAMAGLAVILAGRLVVAASRDLTGKGDVAILALLFLLTASGYLASHPESAPFAPRALLLLHMLLGDLALVLTPMTKIVHCVLTPLTQVISEIGWHFPAESGRHVAIALAKENEPI